MKDLSKVNCFRCGEFGHYNTECPLRNKDKQKKQDHVVVSIEIDKLSLRLEEYFSMFVAIPLRVSWGNMEL